MAGYFEEEPAQKKSRKTSIFASTDGQEKNAKRGRKNFLVNFFPAYMH